MTPRAKIREAIQIPLQKCYPVTDEKRQPCWRPRSLMDGRFLSLEETARLAMMGQMERDVAIQAILKRIGKWG